MLHLLEMFQLIAALAKSIVLFAILADFEAAVVTQIGIRARRAFPKTAVAK